MSYKPMGYTHAIARSAVTAWPKTRPSSPPDISPEQIEAATAYASARNQYCLDDSEVQKKTLYQSSLFERFLNDPRTQRIHLIHKTSIHVAILVKRNKVLAEAHNKIGSRSRGAGYSDCSIHAEKNVFKELGDLSKVRGADLYVMRISRDINKEGDEKLCCSKPCSDCWIFLTKCMKEYGLKNVYYTS